MSERALPISHSQFQKALKSLPTQSLNFKVAELRRSIAHLTYSNQQLKPFANGSEASLNGQPDLECEDAIRENEVVIARFQDRINLLTAEIKERVADWLELENTDKPKQNMEGETNIKVTHSDQMLQGNDPSHTKKMEKVIPNFNAAEKVHLNGSNHQTNATESRNSFQGSNGNQLDNSLLHQTQSKTIPTVTYGVDQGINL